MNGTGLETYAFRMQLDPDRAAEYRARHDAIPDDLVALLREVGVIDYSIHLDPQTNALFAILRRPADHRMGDLPSHPVMRRWWASMAEMMETHADGEPVAVPLLPMFRMD